MGFSTQENWSGLPFPSPRVLPDPEIELASPASPAFLVWVFPTEEPDIRTWVQEAGVRGMGERERGREEKPVLGCVTEGPDRFEQWRCDPTGTF